MAKASRRSLGKGRLISSRPEWNSDTSTDTVCVGKLAHATFSNIDVEVRGEDASVEVGPCDCDEYEYEVPAVVQTAVRRHLRVQRKRPKGKKSRKA